MQGGRKYPVRLLIPGGYTPPLTYFKKDLSASEL
nr:MAG TPA: hypothetical protein [Caudoviricetes sp.]